MREGPPTEVIASSHSVRPVVSSWLGPDLLAADLPVDTGTLDLVADNNVPGVLSLTLGPEWAPTGPRDPVGIYGQTLTVGQVIGSGGREWAVDLGRYLITRWEAVPDAVALTARSLEQLVADARFPVPRQPAAGATYASEVLAVVEDLLPVYVHPDLTDRAIPLAYEAVEDRLQTLRDLAAAWPAEVTVDDDGILVLRPPTATKPTPDVRWAHGTASAAVALATSADREEVSNGVIARGQAPDGTDVYGAAYDTDPHSPTRWGGPFGKRPAFYYSPLLTTFNRARQAAATRLAAELARSAVLTVTAPPDPRIQLGDTAEVTDRTGRVRAGRVLSISLPLTALEGPATYEVGVPPL